MQIHEIVTSEQEALFYRLPYLIYRNVPNWIAPIEKEVRAVFNKKTNKFLRQGARLKRFICIEEAHPDKVVGRIAVFINPQYKNKGDGNKKVGGIGFFESIEEESIAHALFSQAEQWLRQEGCDAVDGPINLGERNHFWGLLVEGFSPPLYGMNYHPPYYKRFFESYGFKCFYEQLCFGVPNAPTWKHEKIEDIYEEISKNPDFHIETIRRTTIRKHARDFTAVYNEAWASHQGNKAMHPRVAYKMFRKMRFIIEPHLSYIAYYKKEPVGVMINIPDMNFYFKRFRGKWGLWQKFLFLLMKLFRRPDRFVGIVYGISPKVQRRGVDALMIIALQQYVQQRTSYRYYEIQWVGDFNTKMVQVASQIAPTITRRLRTYRLLFNKDEAFQRHPYI